MNVSIESCRPIMWKPSKGFLGPGAPPAALLLFAQGVQIIKDPARVGSNHVKFPAPHVSLEPVFAARRHARAA